MKGSPGHTERDLHLVSGLLERLFPEERHAVILLVSGKAAPSLATSASDADLTRALRAVLDQIAPSSQHAQKDCKGEMSLPLAWVKLKKYTEMSGDSAAAVHARRRAGKWLDGVHCRIADEALWVNVAEAQKWVAGWGSKPIVSDTTG